MEDSNTRKRTKTPSVIFVNGLAHGWAFRVSEAFRPALDIMYGEWIDKKPTEALRAETWLDLGFLSKEHMRSEVADPVQRKALQSLVTAAKVMWVGWGEGVPPKYAFSEGDILYPVDGGLALQVQRTYGARLSAAVYRHEPNSGRYIQEREFDCFQNEFAQILKYGLAIHDECVGHVAPGKISEKAARILRSKSDFTSKQINGMSDREAWIWIYGQAKPNKKPKKKGYICFTGFARYEERAELEAMASQANMGVMKSVDPRTTFLCIGGPNPGPSTMVKARAQGVILLTPAQFKNLLETGELPPY